MKSWIQPAKRLITALRRFFALPAETLDLFRETARNSLYTLIGLYIALHIFLTLWGTGELSGRVWALTFAFFFLHSLVLWLLPRAYLLSQVLWLSGLAALILWAVALFGRAEIYFLLLLLPLMAVFTLGVRHALVVLLTLMGVLAALRLPMPAGYAAVLALGLIAAFALGRGLSSNWLSALESASYHYQQARQLLDETRRHRAQISRMLKEQHQANYQLERLNQMLELARAQAEEARDDRDRFILAVSHELRSPLNFILGFSDLMAQTPETYAPVDTWPPGLYDDVQEIYRSSKHLLGLVNDILDLGKIDAQRMTIYREKADLGGLFDEVLLMTQDVFAKKGLWLRAEVADDLPLVMIDRTRIRQVLLNLLTNALRFTEQGGVTLEARLDGDNVRVQVTDTGHGIAPDDLPKVFDVFRQVGEPGWRRREGTGLGLAISRRFIELHGGQMDVRSAPGEGTTFWFTLPVSDADLPQNDAAAAASRCRLEKPRRSALLLSHDPVVQRLMRAALDGFEVISVDEPQALPEAVREHYPWALLMDNRFSPQEIPPLPYDLPIIRFTLSGMAHERTVLPDNVREYLVKPVLRHDLGRAVRALGPDVRRLLIVDDDPAMRRFVEQTLRGEGTYTLKTADSGQTALQVAAAFQPDALLLDLELPDMSGYDLLAALDMTVPVLIISAADPPVSAVQNSDTRLDVYLRRNLSAEELQAVLKPLLMHIQPRYPREQS